MASQSSAPVSPAILRQIEQAVRSIRYGTVQVTVHDARVVQIEKLERLRISPVDLPLLSAAREGATGGQDTTTPTDRTSEGSRQIRGR